MSNAKVVLTDSGGIQEETTFLQIPCLTLRDNTERPITTKLGTNQVVETNPTTIIQAYRRAEKWVWILSPGRHSRGGFHTYDPISMRFVKSIRLKGRRFITG